MTQLGTGVEKHLLYSSHVVGAKSQASAEAPPWGPCSLLIYPLSQALELCRVPRVKHLEHRDQL